MQTSIYQQLENKTVRDLYWLLFSVSPLNETYDLSPFELFPSSLLKEWQQLSSTYFLNLDRNANEIENFVDRKKNKRLGFYAEALLSYFFQTFQEVKLLLQNHQVIVGQKTMGEIDFIIQYKQRIIHLECAVKYYLLKDKNHQNEAAYWVGPKLKDNLDLKLKKMVCHQLPLGKREEVQAKLNQSINESYLFLKGLFFTENQMQKGRINSSIPQDFIRVTQLEQLKIKPIEILERPHWLSDVHPSQKMIPENYKIVNTKLSVPQLVLFNDLHVRFVVPDDWGKE